MLSRHPAYRKRGGGAGGRHKAALARLHSGRVAHRSAALRCRGRGLVRGPSGAHSLAGIVRTLISEDGKGREQFDQAIASLDRGDIPSVFIALQAAPKHDVLHMYLLIEGRIELRLNIAEYLPGTSERCWDGVERAPKLWAVCTGPVSRPPEPIKRRGFQGFRYTEELW